MLNISENIFDCKTQNVTCEKEKTAVCAIDPKKFICIKCVNMLTTTH